MVALALVYVVDLTQGSDQYFITLLVLLKGGSW